MVIVSSVLEGQVEKSERCIMSGFPKNMKKTDILKATASAPPDGDYVWDGQDEDDRPLSKEEMHEGIAKKQRGRPKAEVTKDSITIRLSHEVTEYFRATGQGWQTRLDEVLKDYVRTHR
jgi:uncharacterized protein (DUF4415 family)